MMMGQAAGVAAHLAIANHQAVQDIDTTELTRILKDQGVILQCVFSPQMPILQMFRKALPIEPVP